MKDMKIEEPKRSEQRGDRWAENTTRNTDLTPLGCRDTRFFLPLYPPGNTSLDPREQQRGHTQLQGCRTGAGTRPRRPLRGGGPHLDPELEGGFADLTAFLSAEEIHRSLDLALEAFGGTLEDPESSKTAENPQTKASSPSEGDGAASEAPPLIKHTSREVEKPTPRLKPLPPVYKQDKPRLLHEGLELNDRAASTSEFCSRAATFIEELSSIFRGSAHQEDDASSPDSGYLTPHGQKQTTAPPQNPRLEEEEEEHHQEEETAKQEEEHPSEPAGGPDAPPVYHHHHLHHPPLCCSISDPADPPLFPAETEEPGGGRGEPHPSGVQSHRKPPPSRQVVL
ncbi:palladin-like [Trematomus bernacchii]|uniref:palladin-like n=1 Tax=Trematomus bernacchii TaxID=40690 RepID=UPI00146F2598|nr:palladin-like [Trematomus bernacchii]